MTNIGIQTQILYGFLCIVWNLVVVVQTQLGFTPIGPTGSWVVIIVATVLIFALYQTNSLEMQKTYLTLSAFVCFVAVAAIYTGLTGRAALWPSRFWQVAGLSINILGALSFVAVVLQQMMENKPR